jgi:hypothetical protein
MITLNHQLHVAVSVPRITCWQLIKQLDPNGVKRCQRAASARTPRMLTCSAATLSPQQVQKRSRDGAEADEKGLADYKVLCYRLAVELTLQCSSMSKCHRASLCWRGSSCCIRSLLCCHPLLCLNLQCPEICARYDGANDCGSVSKGIFH